MNATSLADLWVQAAINVDNEEVFENDSETDASDHELVNTVEPFASTSAHSPRPTRLSVSGSISRPVGGAPRRLTLQDAGGRRPSVSSLVPAIFSHTGVRTPPNIASVPSPGQRTVDPLSHVETGLSTIAESRPVSEVIEKPPSTWSMLPLMIIFQYGLLALHSTTHDQVFYLYLVS